MKGRRKREPRNRRLTKAEAEVLSLLTEHGLNVAQIAVRRETTKRAVTKMRLKLIRKGLLEGSPTEPKEGGVSGTTEPKIRLHAMQWKVAILHVAGWEKLKARVIPDFMGCYVSVAEGYVEIYAKEKISFYGANEWECYGLALEHFERVGLKLQEELHVRLIRPGAQNWELVKHEIATEGSKVAQRHIGDGVPLRVFAREDGHLWFWGDWSKKVPEHETGGRTAKVDSEEVNKHLNDWRDFHPPTNSQLFGMLHRILEIQEQAADFQKEQSAGLAVLIKLAQPPSTMEERRIEQRPFYVG